MGFYKRVIFPRLCDLLLGGPLVARHRRALLAEAYGEVLEVGFGTGLNLPFYPEGVRRLTAVDPNDGTHALARQRSRRSRVTVERRVLSGERLPFDDGTFDCVVSTFTLCSITDVGAALSAACRVLRPGGRFLFFEHGLSPDAPVRRWQMLLNRLQMWLGDGCRLDRDVRGLVESQPFSSVRMEQFYLRGFPWTHGYVSRGVATK